MVLAEGTYQGTRGIFLGPKEDANWADITEENGEVRSHPVAWLAHRGGSSVVRLACAGEGAERAPGSAMFAVAPDRR